MSLRKNKDETLDMAEEARPEEMRNEKHQTKENQGSGSQTSNNVGYIKKPSIPYVKICISSQDGDEHYYRVRRDTKIGRLLFKYCHENHIYYHAASFICDGRQVKSINTPNELGMVNGDVIDVMLRQIGGGH